MPNPDNHPIRRYCEKREITQRAFADIVGFTEGFISQMIRGHDVCGRNAALQIFHRTGGDIGLEELLAWEADPKVS